ncbi:NAD(P)/FAD-dependent oxidoreductase [Sphingobacterium sp. HJSM2_6]|uniref:NAD(P)/FAD-dependent oxidoreductase n=1 Tax=Sphingobacterium sp. HJSM2_6 TaxID=3366264 RepID=UPI003BC42B1B
MNEENTIFDVIIIGGSYAGLSAAMSLGRCLRRVLIIDHGQPCNKQTPHSHNFITQDGEKPSLIAEKAKKQVLAYDSIQFLNDEAIAVQSMDKHFIIKTKSTKTFTASKVVLATGIKDLMPDIPGFSNCWGISVVHCPYCHGYEAKNQKTGILMNGEVAFHITQLVYNLSKDLRILTNGPSNFSSEQTQKLSSKGIEIIEKKVQEITQENGVLKAVIFSDNTSISLEVLYARLPFEQSSSIINQLGCECNELGYLKVDQFQMTTVKGVYACGDNSSPMRSVANAVASGNLVGALINKELSEVAF